MQNWILFDWLVIGQIVPFNPTSSVRSPKYSIKKGRTPVMSGEDARKRLDRMDTSDVVGLRDRALIGLMVYSFARISAVVGMEVGDYITQVATYPTMAKANTVRKTFSSKPRAVTAWMLRAKRLVI